MVRRFGELGSEIVKSIADQNIVEELKKRNVEKGIMEGVQHHLLA